jgi:hypothetical protein
MNEQSERESGWYTVLIYYEDLDALLKHCISPLLTQHRLLERSFYIERHYAGGSHLRLHLQKHADTDFSTVALIRDAVCSFIEAYPSMASDSYDPIVARQLLINEREVFTEDDLVYRVNQVEVRSDVAGNQALPSMDSRDLLRCFHRDSLPLVLAILHSNRSKMEEALRLFFFYALYIGGNLPRGAVAFKSHYTGFVALKPKPELNARINASFLANQQKLDTIMTEVSEIYGSRHFEGVPTLALWHKLLQDNEAKVRSALDKGKQLTFHHRSLTETERIQEELRSRPGLMDSNPFLDVLWNDARFMASFAHDPQLIVPRVLLNLLYTFLTVLGLRVIDSMSLCC